MVSQPAHAWLAGQLARHWGNRRFGEFAPWEEVCQAAALHDIGFLNWEQAPTLNPATGLPHCFLDMPARVHLLLWAKSVQKMMRYGRYPALLVSRHFVHLCQRHRQAGSPKEFNDKQAFIKEQEILQDTLLTSLQNDFYYAPCVEPGLLNRNCQLLSVWDWLSLSLCIGFGEERVIEEVPAAQGQISIKITKLDDLRFRVSPWPFGRRKNSEPLRLICEGRRLLATFTDETKMREALRAASPVTLKFDLVPK